MGQIPEDAVSLLTAFGADGDGEVVADDAWRAKLRWNVAAHEHGGTDGVRHMHHAVHLFFGNPKFGGRIPEGLDKREITAEDRAVEIEHLATVAVEAKYVLRVVKSHLAIVQDVRELISAGSKAQSA